MPIYDYECRKCGESFEMWHQHMDYEPEECPHCGGEGKRVFSKSVKLKSIDYKPPPLAKRRFGDDRRTAHRPKKWHNTASLDLLREHWDKDWEKQYGRKDDSGRKSESIPEEPKKSEEIESKTFIIRG